MFFIGVVEVSSGIHGVLQTGRRMFHEEIALTEGLLRTLLLIVFLPQLIMQALHRLLPTLLVLLLDRETLSGHTRLLQLR